VRSQRVLPPRHPEPKIVYRAGRVAVVAVRGPAAEGAVARTALCGGEPMVASEVSIKVSDK
jgi:ribosomal protein L36